MRVSRSNESLQIKENNRELKEVDNFKCLGNVLTRDGLPLPKKHLTEKNDSSQVS